MQKHLLFLQALIIRMLFQAIIKGSRKPLTHLFCGRSRKGKYQQVIYIHRMFRVRQKRADVFDQNRCLAASGGSSNQKIPVSITDDLLLLRCPVDRHYSSPSSSSSRIFSHRVSVSMLRSLR